MVSAAMLIDQFHPALGKMFEGIDLGRIDHVFNDTGDHRRQASLLSGTRPAAAW
jgi:hypothetical protein